LAQHAEARVVARAPREVVWGVLEDSSRYAEWGPWNRVKLVREGDEVPYGVGSQRILTRSPVNSLEEIVAYEPPSRVSYALLKGLPMRDYVGDVRLADTDGGTEIHWRSSFEPKIPGTGWFFHAFMTKVLGDVARTAAAEAEKRAGKSS
jgi:uncharacterized protein YndB with AHSA1/START domain